MKGYTAVPVILTCFPRLLRRDYGWVVVVLNVTTRNSSPTRQLLGLWRRRIPR